MSTGTDPAFVSTRGKRLNAHNLRARVLRPVVEDLGLGEEQGRARVPEGVEADSGFDEAVDVLPGSSFPIYKSEAQST